MVWCEGQTNFFPFILTICKIISLGERIFFTMVQSYGRLDTIKWGISFILLAAAIAFSKPHGLMWCSMSVCMEVFWSQTIIYNWFNGSRVFNVFLYICLDNVGRFLEGIWWDYLIDFWLIWLMGVLVSLYQIETTKKATSDTCVYLDYLLHKDVCVVLLLEPAPLLLP